MFFCFTHYWLSVCRRRGHFQTVAIFGWDSVAQIQVAQLKLIWCSCTTHVFLAPHPKKSVFCDRERDGRKCTRKYGITIASCNIILCPWQTNQDECLPKKKKQSWKTNVIIHHIYTIKKCNAMHTPIYSIKYGAVLRYSYELI